jgi:hypothetical protein
MYLVPRSFSRTHPLKVFAVFTRRSRSVLSKCGRCLGYIRTIYMPRASRRYRPASAEYIRRAYLEGV